MKKLIFILIALMIVAPNALAASLTVSIGTYDTSVVKDEQFSAPATITLSGSTGSTTVDVTITPVTGLSCTTCTNQLSFTSDGNQQTSFTLTADTVGEYSSPFTVTAEAAGVTPGSDTADNPITVSESALWSIDLTSSVSEVEANESVNLDLTVTVTAGTLEGVSANLLTLPSGWTLTSGVDPYSMGDISSVGTASWTVYSGASPGESNTISVDVVSTTPSDSKSDSVSISGPEEEEDGGGDGAGGGGGGTVPRRNQTTRVWQLMTPGVATIMKITNKDFGINQISITVKSQVNNAEITVTKLSKQPATITKTITGKAYKYLDITKKVLQDANLAKIEIEFQVEKTWINSNNIDENTVKLYRYSGTNWAALSTTKTDSDTSYIYYKSTSPGLSVFAIAGEEKEAPPEEPEEEEEEEEAPVEEELEITAPPTEPVTPRSWGRVIKVLLCILILGAVIGIIAFIYNQNPEFRANVDDKIERVKEKFRKQ